MVKVNRSAYLAKTINGELIEVIEPDTIKVSFRGETHHVIGLNEEVMGLARMVMSMKEVEEKAVLMAAETVIISREDFASYCS